MGGRNTDADRPCVSHYVCLPVLCSQVFVEENEIVWHLTCENAGIGNGLEVGR